MNAQNRFIIMLHATGGRSTHEDSKMADRVPACCQDLVLRNLYAASPGEPRERSSVWISVPGLALQTESLERVRSQGRWWKQIADAIEREYCNTLGHASNSFKNIQDRMQEERMKTAKLCQQSVENSLSREQSIALHDDLIQAFLAENFQKDLATAWASAKGNKTKEQKLKRELCLPLQLPIMEKYGFEKSEKGVFQCLWSVRTTFFNFTRPEEVDQEMQLKAVYLDFLVSPGKDLHPDMIPFARSICPEGFAAVCEIRAQILK